MKIDKAIEVLKKNKPTNDPRECGEELCKAVDVAIKALERNKEIVEAFTSCNKCCECLNGADCFMNYLREKVEVTE